jgi:hypothetical protein
MDKLAEVVKQVGDELRRKKLEDPEGFAREEAEIQQRTRAEIQRIAEEEAVTERRYASLRYKG